MVPPHAVHLRQQASLQLVSPAKQGLTAAGLAVNRHQLVYGMVYGKAGDRVEGLPSAPSIS